MVRGEAVISYSDFALINDTIEDDDEKYANPRNLASGTLSLDDAEKVKERRVRFHAFTLVHLEDNIVSWGERMEFLEKEGFMVVDREKTDAAGIADVVERWTKRVENGEMDLPVDGLVICYDDTEYSLRVRRYSRFLVVTDAVLNHRSKAQAQNHPRRYDWKDYYAIRNRLLMVKEHGTVVDEVVNFLDIFVHVIFRNWLFGLIRRDHYDWKYERGLVRAALRDSGKAKPVTGKVSERVYVK